MKLISVKTLKELPKLQDKEYYKVEKLVCDLCDNEIVEDYYEYSYLQDSMDSYEHKDICSNCMIKHSWIEEISHNYKIDIEKMKKYKLDNDYSELNQYIKNDEEYKIIKEEKTNE